MTRSAGASRRESFTTSDPASARDFLDRAYGARLRIAGWRNRDWRLSVDQQMTGGLTRGDVTMNGDLTFEVDGRDEMVVTTILQGTARYAGEAFDERMGPGAVYVGNHADLHCLCHTHQVHARTVSLPRALMDSVLRDRGNGQPGGWEPSSIRSLPDGGRRWRRTTGLVDELIGDAEIGGSELLLGSAARLMAATALSIFSDRADPSLTAGRRDADPATLRRAIAFIDAEPGRDISVADVAQAASVSSRAVQLAFRRYRDTTPMAYLRQVRLHHAHQELLEATASDGVTVARVAADWGFASPSRFAGHYRTAYGCSPSATLRA